MDNLTRLAFSLSPQGDEKTTTTTTHLLPHSHQNNVHKIKKCTPSPPSHPPPAHAPLRLPKHLQFISAHQREKKENIKNNLSKNDTSYSIPVGIPTPISASDAGVSFTTHGGLRTEQILSLNSGDSQSSQNMFGFPGICAKEF